MTNIQIPPSGVPATFSVEIPAPADLSTLGGVKIKCAFAEDRPTVFLPVLSLGGVEQILGDGAVGQDSLTFVAQLYPSVTAPQQAKLTVNATDSLDPGNTVTVYAWGAQTETGVGALNPDAGGQPTLLTDMIEVGTVEVLTWQAWNRMTGANQGEDVGS